MAFKHKSGILGLQAIADTAGGITREGTVYPPWPLGSRVVAEDATYGIGEFVFLKGVANTVVGSVVQFDEDAGTTALLDTDVADTLIGPVAVAMSANVADQYGWYQVRGKGVAKGAASLADGAKVFATATAGTADDSGVVSAQIIGAKTASALDTPSTGLFEIELDHPWIGVEDTAP
jgi:hypothetical protein